MKLNEIGIPPGARKKIKRLGRGSGSGHGKTSTKGHKGLKARSGVGGKLRIGFEGGQMPLIRRVPKRGIRRSVRSVKQVVNLSDLNDFRKNDLVDPKKLRELNYIKSLNLPVKVLGGGDIKKSLTVQAHAFSKSAAEKIKAAGGVVEIIGKAGTPEPAKDVQPQKDTQKPEKAQAEKDEGEKPGSDKNK